MQLIYRILGYAIVLIELNKNVICVESFLIGSSISQNSNNDARRQYYDTQQQSTLLHAVGDLMSNAAASMIDDDDDGIGVGIDLGTTNSAVSILKDGIPIILEVENNGRTMPSVVYFDKDEENIYVGKEAVEREVIYPHRTYRYVKRIMGIGNKVAQDISNLIPNMVTKDEEEVPTKKWKSKKKKKKKGGDFQSGQRDAIINPAMLYSPTQDEDGNRETISPEYVSSHILRKLFDTAESYTGKKVDRAVIGVPAYFKPTQKDATIRACKLAGVTKVKLLYEPEAAALNYNSGKEQIGQGETDEFVFVFDLGGGTYDVSMLRIGGGLTEVLATSGNAMLGGSDFDYHIAQHLNKLVQEHKLSTSEEKKSFLAIPEVRDIMMRAGEATRIYLSNNKEVRLALPLTQHGWTSLIEGSDVIVSNIEKQEEDAEEVVVTETHVYAKLTRKKMEELCKDDIEALLRPIRECALRSKALLPGDASPRAVEEAFETEKEFQTIQQQYVAFDDFYDEEDDNDDDATIEDENDNVEEEDMILKVRNVDIKEAKRLAQRGRKKARKIAKAEKNFRTEKRRINTPGTKLHEIDGRPISRVVLVGGATRMPVIGRLINKLTGVIPQRTVNPDEAVAMGCAIQTGLYDNDKNLQGSTTVLSPMQATIAKFMLQMKEDEDERIKKTDE